MTKVMKGTLAIFGGVLWATFLVRIDVIEILVELCSIVCLI